MKEIMEQYEQYHAAKQFKNNKGYESFFGKISERYKVCIFGGGCLGIQIAKWLMKAEIKPSVFCDNDKRKIGKEIMGIPCISYDELAKHKNDFYVIVAVADQAIKYNRMINEQLKSFEHIMRNPLGITVYWQQDFLMDGKRWIKEAERTKTLLAEDYSQVLYDILTEMRLQDKVIDYRSDVLAPHYYAKQYLVDELIDFKRVHTVIDCGAYTGDTLEDFIALKEDMQYWCFEMDEEVFKALSDKVQREYRELNDKIHLFQLGVGAENTVMTYFSDFTGGSKINTGGNKTAKIITLDSIEFETKIDFIKMDIEGAEEEALVGAKQLIQRDHPVLAISMYHNMEQFVRIPQVINEILPEYKLYIRHHKNTCDDTVCYAIYQ